ncbi:hypothetical protein BJV82DRAFT_505286 [Fennellomyces sp. T-0311]|nr:hypothetical protein BJV82DRAFT_505286 [Fennellomyces sp. T-0311]
MLRSAFTRTIRSSTRTLHTSTRSAATGGFSRFNPWAKKAVVPPTPAPTEAAKPAVAFNVKHYEEEETSLSWRDQNADQTVEQIQKAVKTIVVDNVSGVTESTWKDAQFDSAETKFKVIKESMRQTGKEVSNRELNNIRSGAELLAHFTEESSSQANSSVRQYFQDNSTTLPPNLVFRQ